MTRSRRFISLDNSGQLGNQYALLIHYLAFSKSYNANVYTFTFENYKNFFSTSSLPISFIYNKKNASYYLILLIRFFIKRLFRNMNVSFFNYFFIVNRNIINTDSIFKILPTNKSFIVVSSNWNLRFKKEVSNNLEFLKICLPLKNEYAQQVNQNLIKIKTGAIDFFCIGVHVRRKDYKTWQGGKYYFSIERYYEFIQKLSKVYANKKVRFVVFSNENFVFDNYSDLEICYSSESAIVDLFTMAKMDLLCGPPSTFSGCASFIGSVPFMELSPEFIKDESLLVNTKIYDI